MSGVPGSPSVSGPSTPAPAAGSPGPVTGVPVPVPVRPASTGSVLGATTGTALLPRRGPSARELLEIDWDYPVYDPRTEAEPGRTAAEFVQTALPFEKAYAIVAGDDPRPLLVVRECLLCVGTDAALLVDGEDNEKTQLLSRWFHCVKLPPAVADPNHPFHALFPEGDDWGHLFLARRDGSERVDLGGSTSRTKLWRAMGKMIRKEYKGNPDKAVQKLFSVLTKFDLVDDELARLELQLDQMIRERGPEDSRVQKLDRKRAEIQTERAELVADAKKFTALGLRTPAPAVPAAAPAAPSAPSASGGLIGASGRAGTP